MKFCNCRTPVLALHGEADWLCNPAGSELLYSQCGAEDKTIKLFPGAAHQLFLELQPVRREVFTNITHWIENRI